MSPGQCAATTVVPGVERHYERQRAFTKIRDRKAAALIIDAISRAAEQGGDPDPPERWHVHADRYYTDIVRRQAGGACWLCGETVRDRLKALDLSLPEEELTRAEAGFLDIAHIRPRSRAGATDPGNLRALCPNCHRLVDRLPAARCRHLLKTDS